MKKIQWRKGNGSLLLGTAIMFITLCFVLMFVQTFIIRQNARDTQLIADSIADGTAVYMANEGGDYADAANRADEISSLIREKMGVDTRIELDCSTLEDESQAAVSVTTRNPFLVSTATISEDFSGQEYNITRTARTEFTMASTDYVSWMINIANDDSHGYCQYAGIPVGDTVTSGRTFNPDVDCSSFVYYALLNNGYDATVLGPTPFTTATMHSILTRCGFSRLPFVSTANLQEGDILWTPSHTEVYIGDGQTVGAHSSENGGINGRPGDQTGDEVSVAPCAQNWVYIFRK